MIDRLGFVEFLLADECFAMRQAFCDRRRHEAAEAPERVIRRLLNACHPFVLECPGKDFVMIVELRPGWIFPLVGRDERSRRLDGCF